MQQPSLETKLTASNPSLPQAREGGVDVTTTRLPSPGAGSVGDSTTKLPSPGAVFCEGRGAGGEGLNATSILPLCEQLIDQTKAQAPQQTIQATLDAMDQQKAALLKEAETIDPEVRDYYTTEPAPENTRNGIDSRPGEHQGATPLVVAVDCGRPDIVEMIFSEEKRNDIDPTHIVKANVNQVCTLRGKPVTALLVAIDKNNSSLIKILVKQGAEIKENAAAILADKVSSLVKLSKKQLTLKIIDDFLVIAQLLIPGIDFNQKIGSLAESLIVSILNRLGRLDVDLAYNFLLTVLTSNQSFNQETWFEVLKICLNFNAKQFEVLLFHVKDGRMLDIFFQANIETWRKEKISKRILQLKDPQFNAKRQNPPASNGDAKQVPPSQPVVIAEEVKSQPGPKAAAEDLAIDILTQEVLHAIQDPDRFKRRTFPYSARLNHLCWALIQLRRIANADLVGLTMKLVLEDEDLTKMEMPIFLHPLADKMRAVRSEITLCLKKIRELPAKLKKQIEDADEPRYCTSAVDSNDTINGVDSGQHRNSRTANKSPLTVAAEGGLLDVVAEFLSDENKAEDYRNLALGSAAANQHVAIVRLLSRRTQTPWRSWKLISRVDQPESYGAYLSSPLYWIFHVEDRRKKDISESDLLDLLKALFEPDDISSDTKVDAKDSGANQTKRFPQEFVSWALLDAVDLAMPKAVAYLFKQGAKLTPQLSYPADYKYQNPEVAFTELSIQAVAKGNSEVVKLLMAQGATIYNNVTLSKLSRDQRLAMVQVIFEGDNNRHLVDSIFYTEILRNDPDPEIIGFLAEKGENVNLLWVVMEAFNYFRPIYVVLNHSRFVNRRAAMIAALQKSKSKLVLDKAGYGYMVAEKPWFPLHHAIKDLQQEKDYVNVIRSLIAAGVPIMQLDANNDLPIMIAARIVNVQVFRLLFGIKGINYSGADLFDCLTILAKQITAEKWSQQRDAFLQIAFQILNKNERILNTDWRKVVGVPSLLKLCVERVALCDLNDITFLLRVLTERIEGLHQDTLVEVLSFCSEQFNANQLDQVLACIDDVVVLQKMRKPVGWCAEVYDNRLRLLQNRDQFERTRVQRLINAKADQQLDPVAKAKDESSPAAAIEVLEKRGIKNVMFWDFYLFLKRFPLQFKPDDKNKSRFVAEAEVFFFKMLSFFDERATAKDNGDRELAGDRWQIKLLKLIDLFIDMANKSGNHIVRDELEKIKDKYLVRLDGEEKNAVAAVRQDSEVKDSPKPAVKPLVPDQRFYRALSVDAHEFLKLLRENAEAEYHQVLVRLDDLKRLEAVTQNLPEPADVAIAASYQAPHSGSVGRSPHQGNGQADWTRFISGEIVRSQGENLFRIRFGPPR